MSDSELPLSRWVCPHTPLLYERDRLFAHAEEVCNLLLKQTAFAQQASDFTNLLPVENCQAASFTPVRLVITDPVDSHVLRTSAPAEIRESVVSLASGAVQGLVTFWSDPYESLKYKLVHAAPLPTPDYMEINLQIAITAKVWCQILAPSHTASGLTRKGTHITRITDFVQTLEASHRSPLRFNRHGGQFRTAA